MVAHPCIGLIRSTPFLIDCKNVVVYGEVCLMRAFFLHIEHPIIIDYIVLYNNILFSELNISINIGYIPIS